MSQKGGSRTTTCSTSMPRTYRGKQKKPSSEQREKRLVISLIESKPETKRVFTTGIRKSLARLDPSWAS